MCDTKRANALDRAYLMLERKGFEVFTPLKKKAIGTGKLKQVVEVPIFSDLLFVHSTREKLDAIEAVTPTLGYRYVKGGKYRESMTVRDSEMDRFINAINNAEVKEFFSADTLPKHLIGNTVIVHGGVLNGYEVTLRKLQGLKMKRRVFVGIKNLAYAEIEISDFSSLEIVKEKKTK